MKTINVLIGIAASVGTMSLSAQEKNLVMNGSFENLSGQVNSTGEFVLANEVSSSNNTSVDLFSKSACGADYDVPANYMGTQESKTGNNYAGIIAYYADDAGVFKTKPGYRKYSEYIQLCFLEPLKAGQVYSISFNASLSEKSAYAVSGLGMYFSAGKTDVRNNAFLNVTPHVICTDIITNTEWTTFEGTYVATGGETYVTVGCFDKYMEAKKVIEPFTNNSRKAYYYIDDIGVSPQSITKDDLTKILSGSCYQLANLNFETDKATILEQSYDELQSLSHFLKTYPYLVVYIDGFTDKTGTAAHNDKLSEERAFAVKAFLVKDGVNMNRLKARGYGENQPIDTANEKSVTNRRVEITICAAPPLTGETSVK
jgi:OmpA-OmpF porin, OOP family